MSLLSALTLFGVFSVLVCSVAWLWRDGQSARGQGLISSGATPTDSPEWLALVAQRQEIENDPHLSDAEKAHLIDGWKQLAQQSRPFIDSPSAVQSRPVPHGSVTWLTGAALLLAGFGLVWAIGGVHPQAWVFNAGAQSQQAANPLNGPTADQALAAQKGHPGDGQPLEERLKGLQARMQAQPDDPNGWVLMARTQAALEQYADAADSLKKALALVPDHPSLLADLADMTAMAQNRVMAGEPLRLVELALKSDPTHPKALALAATAADQAGNTAKAQEYWTLLSQLQQAQTQAAPAPPQPKPEPTPSAGPLFRLVLNVPAKAIQSAKPNAVLFVFLKGQAGPGMPLGALRVPVAQLKAGANGIPFDASHLLNGQTLDQLPRTVHVQARLVQAGNVDTNADDWVSPWLSVPRTDLAAGRDFNLALGQ